MTKATENTRMATSNRTRAALARPGHEQTAGCQETAGRGRVSDQQAGEERRQIEKREPWRRGLSGDGGVSLGQAMLTLRGQGSGPDAADRSRPSLGPPSRIP